LVCASLPRQIPTLRTKKMKNLLDMTGSGKRKFIIFLNEAKKEILFHG